VFMATTTNDTVVMSLRVPGELASHLDELASWLERSRSWVATQAIQEYIEREFAVMAAVKDGDADIEAGRSLTLAEAEPWLRELAAGRYKEPPKSRRR
jgi:predicted transcriptional regulator